MPTIPEDYSSQGLAQVRRTVTAAQVRNPMLGVLGYVLTMVQPRLTVHQAYELTLRKQYGDDVFNTIVKAETLNKEAIANRKPVCVYKPKSEAAKAYAALADEIGERIEARRTSKEVA